MYIGNIFHVRVQYCYEHMQYCYEHTQYCRRQGFLRKQFAKLSLVTSHGRKKIEKILFGG